MAKVKYDYMHTGCMPLMFGAGLLIFGGIKYLGYSWEMALMAVGALAVIKGVLIMAKNR